MHGGKEEMEEGEGRNSTNYFAVQLVKVEMVGW